MKNFKLNNSMTALVIALIVHVGVAVLILVSCSEGLKVLSDIRASKVITGAVTEPVDDKRTTGFTPKTIEEYCRAGHNLETALFLFSIDSQRFKSIDKVAVPLIEESDGVYVDGY